MTCRPLRILYVAPYYEPAFLYGGPARSVPALCRSLASAGQEVTVFTTNANGDTELDVPIGTRVEIGNVGVYYFKRDAGRRFFFSAGLRSACLARVQEFDIIHSDSFWCYPMLPVAHACRAHGVPRIESTRGALMPWCIGQSYWKKRVFLELFARRCLDSAAAIHCTDEVEAEAVRAFGFKASPFVVPNVVERPRADGRPLRSLRSMLDLPEDSLVSIFLGRMTRVKGLDIAVRAFAAVAEHHPQAYFVVAGPDADGTGDRVRRVVADLNLSDRVRFMGSVEGPVRSLLLADANLFVLTSHSENFGMAAAEAMAVGVPVLLSKGVGVANAARSARAGCVVALDPAEIGRAWTAMLDNPSGLRSMGGNGSRLVHERYRPEVVAASMLAMYRQAIQDRKPQEHGVGVLGRSQSREM